MALDHLSRVPAADARPVYALRVADYADWVTARPAVERAWLESTGFTAKPGAFSLLPGEQGLAGAVALGGDGAEAFWDFAALPTGLPAGSYVLADTSAALGEAVALGWGLGGYRYDAYRPAETRLAVLAWPQGVATARLGAVVEGCFLTRDLINTPANDMGPAELAAAAATLAGRFGANLTVIDDPARLARDFPLIAAVGQASARGARLIDLVWGDPAAPKVTLVGKGVCFDSGGLDLKPGAAMELMKKDMGGAAQVLGLAAMIMATGLKLRLRVLIPAVENAVSGNAMRPGDIYTSRAGLSVEIGNTDAEGRLVLADALDLAAAEAPDLLVDFATLTGAARVALGLELPALFTRSDALADAVLAAATAVADPLWRLPLWPGYEEAIKGKVADLTNAPAGGFAGAITAALFLQRFVGTVDNWLHIDLMAWNKTARAGRPEGGEAQGIRALFRLLMDRYGT